MWPSLPTANHIADIANWFFIGSLVVGVVSTILIVWMAGVKEAYWEKDRTESAERIASLVVQGDQLRKDTAEANARALEAKLELAKFKEPRKLSPAQSTWMAGALKEYGVIPFDFAIQTDPEAIDLMEQIAEVLGKAGWVRQPWHDKNAPGVTFTNPGKPQAGIVSFSGLQIQIDDSRATVWGAATTALWKALEIAGIDASALRLTDNSENADAVHIKIGRKP